MAEEQSVDPPLLASTIRTDVPHSARIWNYWMGGKDHYPVDRAAGDAFNVASAVSGSCTCRTWRGARHGRAVDTAVTVGHQAVEA